MKKCIAALAVLCALTACRSAPVAERSRKAPAQSAEAPLPAANEQPVGRSIKIPIEIPIETELETPIVAPPCVVPPTAPPKPPAKPRPGTPPPAPPAAAAVAAAPADGIDARVRPLESPVESVLGKKVQGAKGEDLGRLVDVLADDGGRVRAAVIEFGGFLGVGNRRIAVDWSLLRFHPEDESHALVLNVSVKKLQSVPEYKNSVHPPALTAPQPPASQQVPAAAPPPSAAQGNK
jgi:PRC-barrel domain